MVRVKISMEIVPDDCPDVSWLEPDSCRYDDVTDHEQRAEYQRLDAVRLAAFYAGDWHMTGIRAKAELHIPYGQDYIVSTIHTPGLWGVESDCGNDYRDDIYSDEVDTLKAMLAEFAGGFEIEFE